MEKKKLVKQALAALLLVSAAPTAAIAASGENVFLAGGGCGGMSGCGASGCGATTGGSTGSSSMNNTGSSSSNRSNYYGSQNEANGMLDQEMNRNMTNTVTSKGPTGSYGTSVGSTGYRSNSTGSSLETSDNYNSDDSSYPKSPRKY